ncbi:MAG TPA: PP2C family protein-serine/threonine phosphatase [Rectinemataceae bacterium]|nr:PP2C family protein-serine/threonine phosphatase [Rectinemataceae bacterium]
MGLTLLAFIVGLLLLLAVPVAIRRGRGQPAAIFVVLIDLTLALFAIFHGLVDVSSGLGESPIGLILSKTSFSFLGLSAFIMVAAAMAFPDWPGRWAKWLTLALVPLAAILVWYVFATDAYLKMIFGVVDGVVRFVGPQYDSLADLIGAIAALSALIHVVRAFLTRDRINRQRSLLAAMGTALGVFGLWLVGRGISNAQGNAGSMGILWTFYLLPVPTLLIGASSTYALSVSRIFDWRVFGRQILSWAVLTLLFGVPSGIVIAVLVLMGNFSLFVPIIGAPILFLVARSMATSFARRYLERITAREYREELESDLAHLDLSAGRDAVLAELYRILSGAFDFQDFAVLIEDDTGVYRTVYSTLGRTASIERGSSFHDMVEGSGITVVLRSEAIADPRFSTVREELLGFLDLYRGEAMVFAREGRRIIGAFVIGGRKTGADYTDYDFESFRAIYGKLFVIAYYLRNVARESIVYTVSRELALSDQVLRFALEKVDRIDDPGVDTAWVTRSTRSLGGDFVDFVRMSRQRWFFVLGDISGKGLSASMNMLILKSMIRSFLRIEHDFLGLVQRVNSFIKENLPKGTFFAGVFGYFDFATNSLFFINCGVPALHLYSPSFDAFIEVQGEGKILGFVRNVAPFLKPRKLTLPQGSILVASTDGIIESENVRAERFGKDRLVKSVHERRALPAKAIADGVVEELLDFTGMAQEDDITLLIMKFSQRSGA